MFQWIKNLWLPAEDITDDRTFPPFSEIEYTNRAIDKFGRDGKFIVVCLKPRTSLFGLQRKIYLLNKNKSRIIGLNYIIYRPYIYTMPKKDSITMDYTYTMHDGTSNLEYKFTLEVSFEIQEGIKFYEYGMRFVPQGNYKQCKIESFIDFQEHITTGVLRDFLEELFSKCCNAGWFSSLNGVDVLKPEFRETDLGCLIENWDTYDEQIKGVEQRGWKLTICNVKSGGRK